MCLYHFFLLKINHSCCCCSSFPPISYQILWSSYIEVSFGGFSDALAWFVIHIFYCEGRNMRRVKCSQLVRHNKAAVCIFSMIRSQLKWWQMSRQTTIIYCAAVTRLSNHDMNKYRLSKVIKRAIKHVHKRFADPQCQTGACCFHNKCRRFSSTRQC